MYLLPSPVFFMVGIGCVAGGGLLVGGGGSGTLAGSWSTRLSVPCERARDWGLMTCGLIHSTTFYPFLIRMRMMIRYPILFSQTINAHHTQT